MANFQKFGRKGIAGLLKHDDRQKHLDEEMYHSNKDIKPELTHLNYSLLEEDGRSAMQRYEQRLSEVRCSKRADVNTLVSWVVTLPQSLPPEKEPEFFRETYKFLTNKYGEENVVCASVHKDEHQPHLHFDFIPVVTDKKKGVLKVSAKELVNRIDLQRFHPDLQRYLEQALGCEVEILNGATINGNRTVLEMKQEALQEKVNALQSESQSLETVTACNQELANMEQLLKETNAAIETVKAKAEKKGIFATVKGTIQSLSDVLGDLTDVKNHLIKTFNELVGKLNETLKKTLQEATEEKVKYLKLEDKVAKKEARLDRTIEEAATKKAEERVAGKLAELEEEYAKKKTNLKAKENLLANRENAVNRRLERLDTVSRRPKLAKLRELQERQTERKETVRKHEQR